MLAGMFGGAVGGLAFALLMAAALIAAPPTVTTPMSALLARLLRTDNGLLVWAVHLAAAITFGLVFSLFVAPRQTKRVVPLALLYSVLLWGFGAFIMLRTLTGAPLVLDAPAIIDLGGHLVFGLLLGIVYVAFFREEAQLPSARASKA